MTRDARLEEVHRDWGNETESSDKQRERVMKVIHGGGTEELEEWREAVERPSSCPSFQVPTDSTLHRCQALSIGNTWAPSNLNMVSGNTKELLRTIFIRTYVYKYIGYPTKSFKH